MLQKTVYVLVIFLSFAVTSVAYSEQTIDFNAKNSAKLSDRERSELLGWKVVHKNRIAKVSKKKNHLIVKNDSKNIFGWSSAKK